MGLEKSIITNRAEFNSARVLLYTAFSHKKAMII